MQTDCEGEFGVKILGVCFYYYKDHVPLCFDHKHSHRLPRKREFKEVILPHEDTEPIPSR